jgi:hypothetical protein
VQIQVLKESVKHTVAEREGFEPSVEVSPYGSLANCCLRPLGHLSTDLSSSRTWNSYADRSEHRWSASVAQHNNDTFSGCSKRPFSKAAAREEARRTLRYVEPLSDARTLLADFFSILLCGVPDDL